VVIEPDDEVEIEDTEAEEADMSALERELAALPAVALTLAFQRDT
jgi:hypothetical protein